MTKTYVQQTEFGRRLTALRTRRGLSQRALADNAEVARSLVSRWESGVLEHPRLGHLQALQRALGCRWEDLLGPPR